MIDNLPRSGAIIIGTKNIQKAKEFYKNVFGITVKYEDETYISATCINDYPIEIEALNEYRFPNWEDNNIGTYKNVEFVVSDITNFFEQVIKHGGSIVSNVTIRPWGNAGEINDIDGNTFLIIEK